MTLEVYKDLCMFPDLDYVDQTNNYVDEPKTNSLMDILHGDSDMLTAQKIPNYLEDLITGEDTGHSKRKADSGVEPPNKRSKSTKKLIEITLASRVLCTSRRPRTQKQCLSHDEPFDPNANHIVIPWVLSFAHILPTHGVPQGPIVNLV